MTEIICEKKSYQSRKDAVKDIVGMTKKYKQKFKVYDCDKCGLLGNYIPVRPKWMGRT